jgi:hypothetical protein
VRPTIYFKIIRLARVRFEFETPGIYDFNSKSWRKDRPRRRWEGNIKIDLKGIMREIVDWIHLAQDIFLWPTASSGHYAIAALKICVGI